MSTETSPIARAVSRASSVSGATYEPTAITNPFIT